jgi:diguanylate cyclase (GGDEF)-like protein
MVLKNRLPADYNELLNDAFYINIIRSKWYGIALFVGHLFLLAIDLKRLADGILDTHEGYRYLFYLHIILVCGLGFFLLFLYLFKLSGPGEINRFHILYFSFFIFFILFLSASISSIDQLIHGEITVYIIAILGIAVATYLPLLYRIVIFTPSHVLLLVGVTYFQDNPDILTGHYINCNLVFILAMILSQILFTTYIKGVRDKKKIIDQQLFLKRMSNEDSLTGLNNRRYIDTRLIEEWERANRYSRNFSVVIGDLDFFKKINDSFGHTVGDEVLKKIARIMKETIRIVDYAARYGGEEFLLLFPETGKTTAYEICEKIRRCIVDHEWNAVTTGLTVTMSFGIADFRETEDLDSLTNLADKRLYKAKELGRNRTCRE